MQPVLAVSGWLPAAAALPGHAGVRQAVVEVRRTTDGGLRRTHDAVARRGRAIRWSQRAGTRGREPAAWRAAAAGGCATDPAATARQELR